MKKDATHRLDEDMQLAFCTTPRQVERLTLRGIANVVLKSVAVRRQPDERAEHC